MSKDDQLMMIRAHPLIPDDGHEEEIDPADLVPSTSGNNPIINVPASRVEEGREEMVDMYNFLCQISEQVHTSVQLQHAGKYQFWSATSGPR